MSSLKDLHKVNKLALSLYLKN